MLFLRTTATRHSVTIPAVEYLKVIENNPRLSIHVMCQVKQTGQAYAAEELVTIWRPDLKFEALPRNWLLGKQLSFYVRIRNPLNVELTDCVLRVSGNVMKGQLTLPQRSVTALYITLRGKSLYTSRTLSEYL